MSDLDPFESLEGIFDELVEDESDNHGFDYQPEEKPASSESFAKDQNTKKNKRAGSSRSRARKKKAEDQQSPPAVPGTDLPTKNDVDSVNHNLVDEDALDEGKEGDQKDLKTFARLKSFLPKSKEIDEEIKDTESEPIQDLSGLESESGEEAPLAEAESKGNNKSIILVAGAIVCLFGASFAWPVLKPHFSGAVQMVSDAAMTNNNTENIAADPGREGTKVESGVESSNPEAEVSDAVKIINNEVLTDMSSLSSGTKLSEETTVLDEKTTIELTDITEELPMGDIALPDLKDTQLVDMEPAEGIASEGAINETEVIEIAEVGYGKDESIVSDSSLPVASIGNNEAPSEEGVADALAQVSVKEEINEIAGELTEARSEIGNLKSSMVQLNQTIERLIQQGELDRQRTESRRKIAYHLPSINLNAIVYKDGRFQAEVKLDGEQPFYAVEGSNIREWTVERIEPERLIVVFGRYSKIIAIETPEPELKESFTSSASLLPSVMPDRSRSLKYGGYLE